MKEEVKKTIDFLEKYNLIDKNFYYPFKILNFNDEEKQKCDIALVHSGRNRGKSYGISMHILAYCWLNDKEMIFFRRFDKELKRQNVINYFADKTELIKIITNYECDCINIYNSKLYFCKTILEKNKTVFKPIKPLGYYYSLNLVNQLKSMQFPDVDYAIVEEVFTTDTYTENEPMNIINMFSTVARNRDNFTIFMISNNVSRINPYTNDWGLKNLSRQKSGTIENYKFYTGGFNNGKEKYLNILIEYLSDKEELKQSEITSKNVYTNKWEVHSTNRILKQNIESIEYLGKCIIFEYNEFKFKCDFVKFENELILYITRKTTLIKENTRTISNKYYEKKLSKYVSKKLNKQYCKLDYMFLHLYTLGRIAYCDNLTADEFIQILPHLY